MSRQRVPVLLGAALLGVFAVAVLLLGPMIHRLDAFRYQERLLAEDAKLLSGSIRHHRDAGLIGLKDVPVLIDEITDLGAAHAITFSFLDYQRKGKTLNKNMDTLAVAIETQSTFRQLAIFMGELNHLRHGMVLVDSFQITRDAQEPAKVTSKMSLQICLKKEARGKK
jgi:hypothetical protein